VGLGTQLLHTQVIHQVHSYSMAHSMAHNMIIKLEGKTSVRTLDELKELMEVMIEHEKYELCSKIKYVIDNYNSLVLQLN
jgi:DNA-directed RNA polymerase subunit L